MEAVHGKYNTRYSTLDDVSNVNTSASLQQTFSDVLLHWIGVIFTGRRSPIGDPHGGWGRKLQLAEDRVIQVRFSPRTFLEVDSLTGCYPRKEISTVYIATRIQQGSDAPVVSSAILFRGHRSQPGKAVNIGGAQPGAVNCPGLHVLSPAIFALHLPQRGAVRASISRGSVCNSHRHRVICSTSQTIVEARAGGSDYRMEEAVAPGSSVFELAHQLASARDLAPSGPTCTWVSRREFESSLHGLRSAIVDSGLTNAATEASCIVELLSASGLVDIQSVDFFRGALPELISGPCGMNLLLAASVRLALHWEAYGLLAPETDDIRANESLRVVFESTCYPPVEVGNRMEALGLKRVWVIDVVTRMAFGACDSRNTKHNTGSKERRLDDAVFSAVRENLLFWQRVGQNLVTRTLAPSKTESSIVYIGLCTHTHRRNSIIALLRTTETWLRVGAGIAPGLPKMPDTDIGNSLSTAQLDAMWSPFFWGEHASGTRTDTESLIGDFSLVACTEAVRLLSETWVRGTSAHCAWGVDAYVSSQSQVSRCSTCEEMVHVLPSVLFKQLSGCSFCSASHCRNCEALALSSGSCQRCKSTSR